MLEEERWRQILSSLVVCFFARGIYQPDTVSRALALAGFELSADDLRRIGEEIHRNKHELKIREGFSLGKLRIPGRILETGTPIGHCHESGMREAVEHFRRLVENRGER